MDRFSAIRRCYVVRDHDAELLPHRTVLIKLSHGCQWPAPEPAVPGRCGNAKSRFSSGCLVTECDDRDEEMTVERSEVERSEDRTIIRCKCVVDVVVGGVASEQECENGS